MGVMPCSRKDCPHVLCNRRSRRFGYICYDCFEELSDLGPTKDIQEFMDSSPDDKEENIAEMWRRRLEGVFPERE